MALVLSSPSSVSSIPGEAWTLAVVAVLLDASVIATIVASVGGGTAIFSFLGPLVNRFIERWFRSGDREEEARVRLIEAQQRLVEDIREDLAWIVIKLGGNPRDPTPAAPVEADPATQEPVKRVPSSPRLPPRRPRTPSIPE
jgi:hypothetical protein